jgi:hypothetical protein
MWKRRSPNWMKLNSTTKNSSTNTLLKYPTIKQEMQKQQEQVNSLQTQLDAVDEELDKLTSVYSPYRGKVRRVKILGKNERSITAEVTLDIRGEK